MTLSVVRVFIPEGGSVALNWYEMCWRMMHQVSSRNTLKPFDYPYTGDIFFMLNIEVKNITHCIHTMSWKHDERHMICSYFIYLNL